MASDPIPPWVPVDRQGLVSVLEQQIEGPLREAVLQADLRTEQLVEEALQRPEEILGEVNPQRVALEELRSRRAGQRTELLARIGAILSGLLISAVGAADVFLPLPSWLLWATGALAVLALVGAATRMAAELKRERRDSARSSSASQTLSIDEQIEVAEEDYRGTLARAVQRWVSEQANQALGLVFSPQLPEVDPKGLAEIDDSDYEIPTGANHELEALIEHMPGGSVGVSGPRGAGKSTLLLRQTVGAKSRHPSRVKAAVMIDAPVEYDARDFVLHLFARLCETTLDPDRVERMRSWGSSGSLVGRLGRIRSFTPFPAYFGPLLLATGLVALAILRGVEVQPATQELFAILAVGIGGALTYITAIANLMINLDPPKPMRRLLPKSRSLERQAERHLRQIWFQRTFSSGWSGALKVPVGVQLGGNRSAQLAENQLSFPEVVTAYKEFAKALTRDGEVRIGIDELDKMEDEQARRFLNEIKVIFRVRGCFYLVSVSEDAMAYFERRGLPFRDVFDSSFDAVLRVGHLDFDDSRRLLGRRVVGLPAQFIALCHILGGGLARDVIRAARDVCEEGAGTDIVAASESLCREQLTSKCAAARVAIRRLEDPAQITVLSRWLAKVEASAAGPHGLRDRCSEFEREFLAAIGPPPRKPEEGLKQYRDASSVAWEVITFAYFVDTLRELMSTLDTEEATEAALADDSVEQMAVARQAFSINPAEAWEAVSAVRRRVPGANPIPFPAQPEATPGPNHRSGLLGKLLRRESDQGPDGAVPLFATGDRGG